MAGGSSKGTVERIDTGSFDDAIAALDTAIAALANAKNTFVSSTERLTSCWEGYGKDQFSKTYKKLKTKLKDQEDNLSTIRDSLSDIKQSYSDWDADAKSKMQQTE